MAFLPFEQRLRQFLHPLQIAFLNPLPSISSHNGCRQYVAEGRGCVIERLWQIWLLGWTVQKHWINKRPDEVSSTVKTPVTTYRET